MNTKLTLTIEQTIIVKAKKYAQMKERSLSDLIENYLKALVQSDEKQKKQVFSPLVKSLKGSFKEPKNFEYKKELINELTNKHL